MFDQLSCLLSRTLALLCAFTLLSAAALADRRVALVIGNSNYIHTAPLVNPHNDANAVAAALKRLGFEVVLALDVAFAETHNPLREFSQRLQGADVGLLFYAGHALSFEGQNYLVPIDAAARDATDVRFRMTPVNSIVAEIARSTRLSIVVLDACRDNPLARGLARSTQPSIRSSDVGLGLAAMANVGRESLIMFATAPGAVAADGRGQHSPFSQSLLKHMETDGLDIEALVRSVRQEVREATRGDQLPEAWVRLEQRFQFKKSPSEDHKSAVGKTATAQDVIEKRNQDRVYWESVRELNSSKLLQDYIARHPDGAYVEIARAMISKLEAKGKQGEPPPNDPMKEANEAYASAILDGSEAALTNFVQRFPGHPRAAEMRNTLNERASWQAAQKAETRQAYERYLLEYPQGLYSAAARDRIAAFTRSEIAALSASKEPVPPSDRSLNIAPVAPPWNAPQKEMISPSFSCEGNREAAEQTICSSDRLARLDVEMSQVFVSLRGRLSSANAIRLRDSQRLWLRHRDVCQFDVVCIERHYVQRLQQLRGWGG